MHDKNLLVERRQISGVCHGPLSTTYRPWRHENGMCTNWKLLCGGSSSICLVNTLEEVTWRVSSPERSNWDIELLNYARVCVFVY